MDPIFRTAIEADADLLLPLLRAYYAYDEPRARVALVNFLREPSFGHAWLIFDASVPSAATLSSMSSTCANPIAAGAGDARHWNSSSRPPGPSACVPSI